jgi:hypothetical protein
MRNIIIIDDGQGICEFKARQQDLLFLLAVEDSAIGE